MLRLALVRLLLFSLLLMPNAFGGTAALILSQNAGPYQEFARSFADYLDNNRWSLVVAPTPDSFTAPPPGSDVVIAAGAEALRQALARSGNVPIVATLLPRLTYERVLAENPRSKPRVTAIYLDQPPARQAAFLRHLLPNQKRIGMLFSNETRHLSPQFRQALQANALQLDSEDTDSDQTLLPALNALFSRNSLLLAIPDSSIYRRENVRAILVTSYRFQRPVIAFSAAFVQAGALAGLYSTPAQIARQTADLLPSLAHAFPAPMHPSQFAISINQNVAESLGLYPLDEAAIRRALLNDKDAR